MSKRLLMIVLRACLGLTLWGPAAGACPPRGLRLIARAGMPAPGDTGNFKQFGSLAGLDPAISGRNIVFGAFTERGSGVYGYFDDELRVIADTNTEFPGTELHFSFPFLVGSGPSISGRNVAFATSAGPFGRQVVCAYINGEFRVIAEAGVTLAPGGPWTFRSFFFGDGARPSISGENVVFTATTNEPADQGVHNGIYAYINGELQVIANNWTPVPGATGSVFSQFGQLDGFSPSISGENVVFIGFGGGGRGVYASINGELRVIAKTGTPRPPGSNPFCGTAFGNNYGTRPVISGENVAFSSCGAIGYINGELRVIADAITPAPDSEGTIDAVSDIEISGENVVFGSFVLGDGGGVTAFINGTLQNIANENTPVPGREEMTFDTLFLGSASPAISGENVVFTAIPKGVYAFIAPTQSDLDTCADLRDVAAFQSCFGATPEETGNCVTLFDFDANNTVDLADFAALQPRLNGP